MEHLVLHCDQLNREDPKTRIDQVCIWKNKSRYPLFEVEVVKNLCFVNLFKKNLVVLQVTAASPVYSHEHNQVEHNQTENITKILFLKFIIYFSRFTKS